MIYVTANGVSEKMLCTELCDEWRIVYYEDYINEMLKGEWAHMYWTKKCKNVPTVLNWNYFFVVIKLFDLFVTQLSKTESMWRAILHGRCWTNLSGMKVSLRDLACTMWTSGTKTSLAIPKLLFSFTNALSASMDFPIKERWAERTTKPCQSEGFFITWFILIHIWLSCEPPQVENWRRKAVETCSSSNQLLAAGQFICNIIDHVPHYIGLNN